MKNRYKIKVRKIIYGVIIFSIITTIFTLDGRNTVSPFEKGVSYIIVPIQNGIYFLANELSTKITSIKNLKRLEEDYQLLLEEVNELKFENKQLSQEKKELESLRALYELDARYSDYPKTGARVIGKDPGNWYEVFMIDKGESDNLKVDMVVIAGNGLVGKIIDVGPNYSKVMSIIDDRSSVSAKIFRTSDICSVSGNKLLNGNALLERIDSDIKLMIGDEVVTSHLGEIYPPGILIGSIKEIDDSENQLTKEAILEPAVDFKHLEEVLVITGKENN